ncbi:MAG: NAD(P)-dependent oxidoreductase [Bacteroidota bacterium]
MSEFTRPKNAEELGNNFKQIKPLMNATMAYYESSRCLFCYDAPCVQACPTAIDIPLFIRQINTGNVKGAAKTIYDSNYFANTCGKVCPTEVLCEGACVYNHQDVKPIEIGRLQSYASTYVLTKDEPLYQPGQGNGKKVAIIGAGPAGISAACDLRLSGYDVDVYEAKSHPSGLVIYGVAPYKITNQEALDEVEYLQKQFNFNIFYNSPISGEAEFKKLEANYQAIFIGIGLGNTSALRIGGEDLLHCAGATEFIERIKIDPFNTHIGDKVVVIGGGNTAMDAASEAARMGAPEVYLAYRRAKDQKGAYEFEYDLAKAVGVKGLFNVSPVQILGKDKVTGIRFIRTKQEGNKLIPIEGSEFDFLCDMVIKATGQSKLKDFLNQIGGIDLNLNGTIKVNDQFQTTNPKYFASGDAVNGGKEVVNAVAEAKIAAKGIHEFLSAQA